LFQSSYRPKDLDYLNTFVLVTKFIVIHLLFVDASNQWILKELDVKNALSHDDLDEEVYI